MGGFSCVASWCQGGGSGGCEEAKVKSEMSMERERHLIRREVGVGTVVATMIFFGPLTCLESEKEVVYAKSCFLSRPRR